ncbi:methyltransferase domain protein [Aeromicrobium marinum DSM 15272]|uniref:Methyltransferase domain protein n=1 Tax=Aeromicrobium marinum DSM 15272 TaxID=585531 RepID=E2S8F5_9ACTN|nr:class I SAM-dependent methyltransferase [Aeromicrobium marinum]EFQ84460.1 methyltransferase domain protein [Aeromicrobium marinum DSM 15272]
MTHETPDVQGAAFWDERYATSRRIWSGNPNPTLVTEIAGMPPGHALDVGCGEGADALWLAAQGWTVVGADLSTVALGRAAEHGADLQLTERVAWQQTDLVADPPEPGSFDLVTSHFTHLPPDARHRLFDGLAAAVRSGGTLLFVGHDYGDIAAGMPRPPRPEVFHTPDELAARLDDAWTVEVSELRPRHATTPEGVKITIHDTVLRARRS